MRISDSVFWILNRTTVQLKFWKMILYLNISYVQAYIMINWKPISLNRTWEILALVAMTIKIKYKEQKEHPTDIFPKAEHKSFSNSAIKKEYKLFSVDDLIFSWFLSWIIWKIKSVHLLYSTVNIPSQRKGANFQIFIINFNFEYKKITSYFLLNPISSIVFLPNIEAITLI